MKCPGKSGQLVNLPTGGSGLALKHGWILPLDGGDDVDEEETVSGGSSQPLFPCSIVVSE